MREGRCFKCRKTGHDARNCRTNIRSPMTPSPSCPPQQILNAEEAPTTPLPNPKPKSSPFANYIWSLGKTEDELLQTLKLCYEEQEEEVKIAKTFKDL